MKPLLARPATADGLFVWVLHRFAEEFGEHAIVKGGIALRLYDCPRSTTDIDYVFVPYESKLDVAERLRSVLAEIDGATIEVDVHSKMIRARLAVDAAAIQIEANVDIECPSTAVATASFARSQGQPSRVVRVMALDRALAHKIAAWNERRLLRDLYDLYYLVIRLGAASDMNALQQRLNRIESRLPALRRRKSMSLESLITELRAALDAIDETAVRNELAPLLPADEIEGLASRIRAGVTKLIEQLERGG